MDWRDTAVFSASATGFAAWAAASASNAAKKMARIETARRHDELTPRTAVTLVPMNAGDAVHYILSVELAGPVALQHVAGVAVRVRDDRPGRALVSTSFQGNRATPEQIAAQIWGPHRLTPNIHHGSGKVDQAGRCIDIRDGMTIGESVRLQMEANPPPAWTGDDRVAAESWWKSTVGTLVRIAVELQPTAAGGEATGGVAWVVPVDLSLDQIEAGGGVTVIR